MNPVLRKLKQFSALLRTAWRTGAWPSFFDELAYRSPWGLRWARSRGHRFHCSTLLWFVDDGAVHTRTALLLPRLKSRFPALETIDMDFEFFDAAGRPVLKKKIEKLGLGEIFVLDSRNPPAWLALPKPFEGSLLIKQTLHHPEAAIVKKQGLFSATHTYIDYYADGKFVTTLHDYNAFLPDQCLRTSSLGMIPAYCDDAKETFLLFNAAAAGIGKKDLRVYLSNANHETLVRRLPAVPSFGVRRVPVSGLFPEARTFLGGQTGQVVVRGAFRQTLTRIAYGVTDRKSGSFSLDHCFYDEEPASRHISYERRSKLPKGHFNPFFVVEDGPMTTSAILFSAAEEAGKKVDLLVYAADGRLVVDEKSFVNLKGTSVGRIDFKEVLKAQGVPMPFVGHAELLHHAEPATARYPTDLPVCIEYASGEKLAHVIFGADLWNPPNAIPNKNYRSVNRVICDDIQTTYVAISNCCYDYQGGKEAELTLSLIAAGVPAAEVRLRIPPNGTIFKAVDALFPAARQILSASGGAGLTLTTDINCHVLTHLFLTQDRASRAVSVEHSLTL
jgi:hypothetical protein